MRTSINQSPINDLPQRSMQRHAGQEYPITSILAILRSDPQDRIFPPDAYLLIQRINPPYLHQWAMVGGKWDFGESLEMAIRREVEEETSLQTTFRSLRAVMNERIYPLDTHMPGGHYILFVCELQLNSGTPGEKNEGPVNWFTYEELQTRAQAGDIIPTDFALLQALREPSDHMAFIEAEVSSRQIGGKREDEILRFEISGKPAGNSVILT